MSEIPNSSLIFPQGAAMPPQFRSYFSGQAFLHPLTTAGVPISNVTFAPGCRNNWHIHHGTGGGQILLCTGGRGWYQAWGEEPRPLHPGDVVEIPPETKHWHGAARDSWFTHLAVEIPSSNGSNEWLDPVDEEPYNKLP